MINVSPTTFKKDYVDTNFIRKSIVKPMKIEIFRIKKTNTQYSMANLSLIRTIC